MVTRAKGGVQLHVRTRTSLLRILGTTGRITLKFGLWLRAHQQFVLQILRVENIVCTCTRAHPHFYILVTAGRFVLSCSVFFGTHQLAFFTVWGSTVHTFKHIFSVPFADRPKGVLLAGLYVNLRSLFRRPEDDY